MTAPACPLCQFAVRDFYTLCRGCGADVHFGCADEHESTCPARLHTDGECVEDCAFCLMDRERAKYAIGG